MQATIHAVFANRTDADAAAQALLNAGFRPGSPTAVGESNLGPPVATLDATITDRLLYGLGLAGTIIGCVVGFVALPGIAARASMYTVIVPMVFTFWGLALGLFSAMGLARFAEVTASREKVNLSAVRVTDVCVSVTASGADELSCVENIASEHRAANLSYEMVAPGEAALEPATVTLLTLKSA